MNPPWLHCWRRGTKSAGAAPGQRSQGRPRPTAELSRAARERMCEKILECSGSDEIFTASSNGAATQPNAAHHRSMQIICYEPRHWSRSLHVTFIFYFLIEFALVFSTNSSHSRAKCHSHVVCALLETLSSGSHSCSLPRAGRWGTTTEAARRSRRTRAALQAHHPHKGPRTREKGQLGREDVQHKQHGARESGAPRNPATNCTLVCLP